jgi:hypothetical protein
VALVVGLVVEGAARCRGCGRAACPALRATAWPAAVRARSSPWAAPRSGNRR